MKIILHYLVSLLALSVLFAVPALGQVVYTITRLDPPSTNFGNFSYGSDINDLGVVVGAGSAQYTTDIMCIWRPGDVYPQQVYFHGYNRTTPEGISDSGHYVGYGPKPDGTHGFLNGIDLGLGSTNAVNNSGQVVGWTYDSLYLYKDGVFDYLPTSYWGSEALSINDSGVAAGYWYTDCTQDCYSEVALFRNDSLILLGDMGGGYAEANDINNVGQLAGWACTSIECTNWNGFIWTNGSWTVIPTLGGRGSEALAINDSGVAVGQAYGSDNLQHAIIYDPVNGIRELNSLIPPGSGWDLIVANDINNMGQITGIGKFNGLTRGFILSPPDTSITIVSPELDQLFIAGESDTIKWTSENVDSVDISVVLHWYDVFGRVEIPIAQNVPAANERYVWEIPDSLLSRQCRIVIQDSEDQDVADTGADFKIKGYLLTRITDGGEYEPFSATEHGFSHGNTSENWWPSSWWSQFNYQSGTDPYTGAKYPSFFISDLRARSEWFIDWPLFVKTFGTDTCYATDTPTGLENDYWFSTASFWRHQASDHIGSCLGIAAASAAAFGNKDQLLQRFPAFGQFTDLYSATLTDERREIVNQLMFTQFAKAQKEFENTAPRNPNEAWIQNLKNIFLDEDRSNDVFLSMYNSRGGGHSVMPYKLIKDSVPFLGGVFYLLYIYDSNHPGDSSRIIAIRSSDGFWRYPPTGPSPWLAYGTGLFLEPFSLYLQQAIVGTNAPRHRNSEANAQSADDYTGLYGFSNASVMIRAGADSLGFLDTTIFNSIFGAQPLVAKTGYFSRPYGYRFPETEIDVTVSNITDSIADFGIFNQESIYSFGRSDVVPSDTERFFFSYYPRLWNYDPKVKTYTLQGAYILPGLEKVYTVLDFDLTENDSSVYQVSGDYLYLRNTGPEDSYDLTLRLISSAGGNSARVEGITFEANASHTLWPDWADLTQPIRVEIDRGNDGSLDDTIYVNAHPTDVTDPSNNLPKDFVLSQNYPNPFNASTMISYNLPTRSNVKLEVFNQLGQRVRTLVNANESAGAYTVTWDGRTDTGADVSSGMYLYRLTADDLVQTKKMLLLK